MIRFAKALATLIATGLLVALPMAAQADAPRDPVQDRLDVVIAEYGGEQTAWNEVSWDDGAVILTVDDGLGARPLMVGSCPSGSYCAYSLAGYIGSRLRFTTCTTGNPVGALGAPVRSIANSRSSGTVHAYNGGSLVLTVSPNSGANTTATITTLSCS